MKDIVLMLHMSKYISAFGTRTLPCSGGWFTVICDMQQRGAWEWENLRLSVYVVGGGHWESPFHCIAPSKCRLRAPERGGVERQWGNHGRDGVWGVGESERACAVPMPPPPPPIPPSPSILLSLCIAWSSQHQRRTPPPCITVKALHSWCNFYKKHHRPSSFQTLSLSNILPWLPNTRLSYATIMYHFEAVMMCEQQCIENKKVTAEWDQIFTLLFFLSLLTDHLVIW